MKKFKLSMLLCVLLIMFVGLIACSSDGAPATTDETDPDETEVDNEEDGNSEEEGNEDEAVEQNEAVDLDGRVIRIANHWDMTPPGGTELRDMIVDRHAEVEEKYNIKIEYVEVTYDEKVSTLTNSILANDPFADLVSLSSAQAASLVKEDYLIPVNDFADLNDIAVPEIPQELGTIDDQFYMIGSTVNISGGLFYNKTMFEQAGLPDPQELQESGEWTWDAMLEAAQELTSGEQYGMSADHNALPLFLIASNDEDILDIPNLEVQIDSQKSMEALEFMAALYNEHRVIKPNEGDNYEDPKRYFAEGLTGMVIGYSWEMEGRADLPFDWGYVYFPKGPQADDYTVPVNSYEGLTIPIGVEDPEIVYQIWEDLQVWEILEDERNEWFELISPNLETYNTLIDMQDNVRPNYWPAYGLEDAFYEMNENIAEGIESPSQAVAKVKGEAQSLVEEFMK
ncbi:ABC transporter substrate-binding protein [Bacillus sp. JCM 19034]|uniref:ABC transporter substrate-binding protein n=1 Tax=Bacillus sp. JCM 19034 TaxID=1481928 RepID=UPI000782B652|nr:extracellular solute-binding protein [Bacillus sp. JCM 19034]